MLTATNSDKIILSSEKSTEEVAIKFSKKLKIGDIVFLNGDMGVGKTTFVKYLINIYQNKNKLKITEVTSPTFTLMNEYQIKEINIRHFDLFRIKLSRDLENLDIFANSSKIITLIEWPQMIKRKPKNLIELNFKYEDDYKKRSVQIKGLNLR